jgi:ribosomal peptide maturation radical SAM protein 1
MPFGPLLEPSLALSILRSLTEAMGVTACVEYLGLDFARRIGVQGYHALAEGAPTTSALAGELVFATGTSTDEDGDFEAYLDDVYRRCVDSGFVSRYPTMPRDELRALLHSVCAHVGPFLEDVVSRILDHQPSIVGFSSTFQQQLSSLAAAKLIKENASDVVVVFGGANCAGPMGQEMLAQFSAVDAVVPGEGELSFPTLVDRVLAGRSWHGIAGVLTRRRLPTVVATADVVENLDATPWPVYEDYFTQLDEAGLDLPASPHVLIETSRGCWWGARMHCTFCGLEPDRMAFRSKSAERVLEEIEDLHRRHPGLVIAAVDNILDRSYFETVLPALAEAGGEARLFYEVKANLTKEQVRSLRNAGIRDIQPGIESLSDGVLGLMRKGVTAIQNVQLLKWCAELGVNPAWNILWAFPGEDPDEYESMARLVPLLTHLPPPITAGPLRVDRFSPLFEQPQHGLGPVEPAVSYRYLYDVPPDARARLAYYFQRPPGAEQLPYVERLRSEVAGWMAAAETSALFSVDDGDQLLVWDVRPVATQPLTRLRGLARDVYMACNSSRSEASLREEFEYVRDEDLSDVLAELTGGGLMIRLRNSYLSLAIPVGEYEPNRAVLERLAAVL